MPRRILTLRGKCPQFFKSLPIRTVTTLVGKFNEPVECFLWTLYKEISLSDGFPPTSARSS